MKITAAQLGIINASLNVDNEGKIKTFSTIGDLTKAGEIHKAIMKSTDTEGKNFIDGEIKLTAEHKVFLSGIIDSKGWTVMDSENVLTLKELLK